MVAGEGFEPSKLSRWIYRPTAASPSPAKTSLPSTTYVRIPHKQPTSAGANRTLLGVYTLPLVAMEARICQLSPLRNDENYVCARTAQPPRVPESVPLIGTHSHSRWAEVDRTSITSG